MAEQLGKFRKEMLEEFRGAMTTLQHELLEEVRIAEQTVIKSETSVQDDAGKSSGGNGKTNGKSPCCTSRHTTDKPSSSDTDMKAAAAKSILDCEDAAHHHEPPTPVSTKSEFNGCRTTSGEGMPSPDRGRMVFADAEHLKKSMRDAVCKQEPYNVTQLYKDTGTCQKIARSPAFEQVTIIVIFLNAIWIAVDADNNNTELITDAPIGFQLVEYSFCLFFVCEWAIRFFAFREKRSALGDSWFVFDTTLVLLMVLETWVLPLVVLLTGAASQTGIDVSLLRLFRMFRVTRVARMVRLVRTMPELMILVKGMAGAARSVFFTLLLLGSIIYVFAIAFRQLSKDTEIGEVYFSTVLISCSTLLLEGTLPDLADFTYKLADADIGFGFLFLLFVLFATLMLMNMLVGVLVDVVTTVSSVEKEQMEATFLKTHIGKFLEKIDENHDDSISISEFDTLLQKPKAIKALDEVGIDAMGLIDLRDFIFRDAEELTVAQFLEYVLQLRGCNQATVKNIVETRMFITSELGRVEQRLVTKIDSALTPTRKLGVRSGTVTLQAFREASV
jgi:hypothetical protein